MSFLSEVFPVLYRPRHALAALKHHPLQIRYAAVVLLVHSAIAMIKMLYFQITDQPVIPPPFLALPEQYGWLYSAYFQVPVDFIQGIVFAGTVTLVAPLFGGKGSFRAQFALYALAFAPPTVVLILSTFVLTLIGMHEVLLWWLVFAGVLAWILATVVEAVKVEQGLSYIRSLAITCVALTPTIAVALTYIR